MRGPQSKILQGLGLYLDHPFPSPSMFTSLFHLAPPHVQPHRSTTLVTRQDGAHGASTRTRSIILVYAALGRGVKRASRLRLVCKTFADAVHPALFETHLMDHIPGCPVGTIQWQLRNQHGAQKLWHEILGIQSHG
jgi:hypothetical protein